jgi:hypothetical protein
LGEREGYESKRETNRNVENEKGRGEGITKGNRGVDMVKIHYLHGWKYPNEIHYFV